MKTIIDQFNEILSFRRENKKCVSTTHTFSYLEFLNILPLIKEEFNHFDVKVEGDGVSVRISTSL